MEAYVEEFVAEAVGVASMQREVVEPEGPVAQILHQARGALHACHWPREDPTTVPGWIRDCQDEQALVTCSDSTPLVADVSPGEGHGSEVHC